MYLKAGKNGSKLDDRWNSGLFLGVQDRSDEVVVGTESGVFKARTVKRLDPVQRRDAKLALEMRGLPWDPVPGVITEDGEVPTAIVKIVAAPVVPMGDLPPGATPPPCSCYPRLVRAQGGDCYLWPNTWLPRMR